MNTKNILLLLWNAILPQDGFVGSEEIFSWRAKKYLYYYIREQTLCKVEYK